MQNHSRFHWKAVFLISFAFILIGNGSVSAWGKVGHETVAVIAEKNLQPGVMEKLKPLLAGKSLEDISTWADEIKPHKRSTAPWHYIDLLISQNVAKFNLKAYEEGENNVISQ